MNVNTNTASASLPARVWKAFEPIASQPRSAVGLVIVLLSIIAAACAPILAPYDPNLPDFMAILAPPSQAHWLGTDDLGRDVLSRIIYGSQASLMVGALSVVGALVVGTLVGLLSGYFGGATDAVLMRIMDVIFAFPAILLALAITAVLGPS